MAGVGMLATGVAGAGRAASFAERMCAREHEIECWTKVVSMI